MYFSCSGSQLSEPQETLPLEGYSPQKVIMANNKGCWKWAIVGGVSAVLVFAIAMIVVFSLQKRTVLPGRSPQPRHLAVSPPLTLSPHKALSPPTALLAPALLPIVAALQSLSRL